MKADSIISILSNGRVENDDPYKDQKLRYHRKRYNGTIVRRFYALL